MLPMKEVDQLRKQFELIDTDKSGFIDATELAQVFKQNENLKIPDDEIDRIIKEVDFAGNGQINYTEFIAATISVNKVLNHSRLESLFDQFDKDGTGFVTPQNMREVFQQIDKKLTNTQIDKILKDHDFEGDKQISLAEFKLMMNEQQLEPAPSPLKV